MQDYQKQKDSEIFSLKASVEENKTRSEKIANEKNALELQTSNTNVNLMDKVIYKSIVAKISETRALYDKNRAARSNQEVDPTIQLVEIEGHINKVLKFLKLARLAEPSFVTMLIKRLKTIAMVKKQADS